MKSKKILTFGEVLGRFSTKKSITIRQAQEYDIHYGGCELNVAIALSNMGKIQPSFFTVLPYNEKLTAPIIDILNTYRIDSKIIRSEGRLGLYFLETGASVRQSDVIYDRDYSSISLYDYSNLDIEDLLNDFSWIHLSGITAALSNTCKKLIMRVLEIAKSMGIMVSFDINYRKSLWSMEEAEEFVTYCLPYINLLIGLKPLKLFDKNGVDLIKDLKKDHTYEEAKNIIEALHEQYPNLNYIYDPIRLPSESSDKSSTMAYFSYKGEIYTSQPETFEVIDRVGSGDASTAGVIYGLMNGMNPQEIVDYAKWSGILTHTILGDYSTFTAEEILAHCNGGNNCDVNR